METKWHKCYDDGWQGIITPDSFQHPAKMSRGLLRRILFHAKIQGWLSEGDVIIDPFGGIGSTGILGAYEGYQVVCCELEEKFVKLAEQNFELHKNAWVEFGNPYPIILQGDSRRLCELIEKADCIVSSPPFQEAQTGGGIAQKGYQNEAQRKGVFDLVGKRSYMPENQGQTPGQLGAMKPGKVDMVVSSPPYAESLSSEKDGIDWSKTHREDGSIGDRTKEGAYKKRGSGYDPLKYGQSSGNLGNLKSGDVDCVISSPPFEDFNSKQGGQQRGDGSHLSEKGDKYAISQENLGNDKGDTFWQAAKTIVEQCHQILKPGGESVADRENIKFCECGK